MTEHPTRDPQRDPERDPELERLWTPSSAIGGRWQPYAEAYRRGTLEARQRLGSTLLTPHVELFGPSPSTIGPALVFVHGGYWQEQSLDAAGFAAVALAERGITLLSVSYPLAPVVTMAEIADSVCRSLLSIAAHAAPLGLDPRRTVVAGHSAGAHLVARAAITLGRCWPLGAVALVSGVFEPSPLIHTSMNDALGLTPISAQKISALSIPQSAQLPNAIVSWGEHDTPPFHEQSRRMSAAWAASGAPVCTIGPVPDRNHFDIVLDLGDPTTALGGALFPERSPELS